MFKIRCKPEEDLEQGLGKKCREWPTSIQVQPTVGMKIKCACTYRPHILRITNIIHTQPAIELALGELLNEDDGPKSIKSRKLDI